MPISSGKTTFALLFAMLTSSCASQNAMSLVPDSVRLDIVRDKAAKAGPVSVDEMLGKARAGAVPEPGAPAKTPSLVATEGAKQTRPPEMPDSTRQSYDAGQNAADMFRLAQDMHDQQQPRQPISASMEDQVSQIQGTEAQWRKVLEDAQLNAENDTDPATEKAAFYADSDHALTTAALPQKPVNKGETIAITFDASLSTLAKDDDLRVRLLRHGKRHPEMIVIGKVEGAQGFAAMQKALSLGKVIADASGGNPGMSYDPALSPRTAELHYTKPGHAQ